MRRLVKKLESFCKLSKYDRISSILYKLGLNRLGDVSLAILLKLKFSRLTFFTSDKNEKYSKDLEFIVTSRFDDKIPVFICWFQGFNNAPDLVKLCRKSVYKYFDSDVYHVCELDDENINSFVKLPESILEKYQNGVISKTHYSDIVRTLMVYTYGGVWADSTMMFYASVPSEIRNSEIFFFKIPDSFGRLVSNQFIYAKSAGNSLLGEMIAALYEFWNVNDDVGSYFFYHYLITAIIEKHYLRAFETMPSYCSTLNHELQKLFDQEFDDGTFQECVKKSFVQKLSYKHSYIVKESFLARILSDNI